MRLPLVTIGEMLAEHEADLGEKDLAIREIMERLPLKDEEGEEPFWSEMSGAQLYNEARRVYAVQKRWVEAQRREE